MSKPTIHTALKKLERYMFTIGGDDPDKSPHRAEYFAVYEVMNALAAPPSRTEKGAQYVFETILDRPIVGFSWIAPDTSTLDGGDRVRVTIESLEVRHERKRNNR